MYCTVCEFYFYVCPSFVSAFPELQNEVDEEGNIAGLVDDNVEEEEEDDDDSENDDSEDIDEDDGDEEGEEDEDKRKF